jgi:cellobiose phosphorylase
VDPSIPADWLGFKVIRKFRNAIYRINVQNPDHVNKGIKTITIDGKPHSGSLLPVYADGQEHVVEILMGRN